MSMHIPVFNSGSSSIKHSIYKMPSESLLYSGKIERIGKSDSIFIHRRHDYSDIVGEQQLKLPVADFDALRDY